MRRPAQARAVAIDFLSPKDDDLQQLEQDRDVDAEQGDALKGSRGIEGGWQRCQEPFRQFV